MKIALPPRQSFRAAKPLEWTAARYGAALGAVALGYLLRLPFESVLGTSAPFVTFFPAVAVAAWWGGMGPGIVTTVLSTLLAMYSSMKLIGAMEVARPADVVLLVLFVSFGFIISWLNGRLHRALRAEEQLTLFARLTLESIGDGVIVTDENGRITFMNEVAEQLLTMPLKNLQGKHAAEVLHLAEEGSDIRVETPIADALRFSTTQKLQNHTDLIRPGGERISIDDTAASIIDGSGRLLGVVFVFRDVSQRREAERMAVQSRDRLRATLESIRDAFIAMDADWRFTYVNSAAEQLVRRSAAELIGRNHWELFPESRGTVVEESYRRARADKVSVRFESYYAPLGTWFDISAFPAEDGGLAIYFQDISERKAAEAKARLTEERLSRLAESNVIGIVFADFEGGIQAANEEYLRILGYTRQEFEAGLIRWTESTPPEWIPVDEFHIRQALQTGKSEAYEKEYVRRDGSRVPVLVGFAVVGDQRQEAVAFVLDLTEEKKSAAAVRESEARIRRSSEELQHFTDAAAHDLKEPLRTLTSYIQLLSLRYRDTLDDRGRDLIKIVLDATGRMHQLVNALAEYSRASDAREAPAEPVALAAILDESLSGLKTAIDEKAAVIVLSELPFVKADPLSLSQILQNLVANALKYAKPEEPPRVEISAVLSGDSYIVGVRDNGIGIAPEYHEKIFEPFQRLHGRDIPGTGLGLAAARKIVQHWGGRIWVESQAGLGSSFFFTVPAAGERSAEVDGNGLRRRPHRD